MRRGPAESPGKSDSRGTCIGHIVSSQQAKLGLRADVWESYGRSLSVLELNRQFPNMGASWKFWKPVRRMGRSFPLLPHLQEISRALGWLSGILIECCKCRVCETPSWRKLEGLAAVASSQRPRSSIAHRAPLFAPTVKEVKKTIERRLEVISRSSKPLTV